MTQIFGSCGRYIQGYDALADLGRYVTHMGRRFLVLASRRSIGTLGEKVTRAMGPDCQVEFETFGGESTLAEVERGSLHAEAIQADAVIGLGGGKVLDTAKAISHRRKIPVVIVPTIAASDAATSSTALLYNEAGTEVVDCINLDTNPAVVLVDTKVILEAPVRFLVAGMGDALSTYLGARVSTEGYRENYFGGLWTHTGLEIAKLSYKLLMQYGRQAKIAAEQKALTDAFNTIVEVNTLMSGLGFENNGSATDHAFFFGMLALPRYQDHALHGEGVAFSCCCQLVLENAPAETLDEVYRFCTDVGLPVTMEGLGLRDVTDEELRLMAQSMLQRPINHPFPVTEETLMGAYRTADAIGSLYLAGKSIL